MNCQPVGMLMRGAPGPSSCEAVAGSGFRDGDDASCVETDLPSNSPHDTPTAHARLERTHRPMELSFD